VIKAIETSYKGYRFRSRLEARWAVFFDSLGLEWEYEPEGFDLGEDGWYLPDFRLIRSNTYIEIKPRKELRESTRFYLAGKMRRYDEDWRCDLVAGKTFFEDIDDYRRSHSDLQLMIGGHRFMGPYGLDEEYFGHGVGEGHITENVQMEHGQEIGIASDSVRQIVFDTCKKQIASCGIVFAWIDSTDCHGTIAEIGFAYAIGKKIWIGFSPDVPFGDFWFVRQMAEKVCISDSAQSAFAKFDRQMEPHEKKCATLSKQVGSNGYVILIEGEPGNDSHQASLFGEGYTKAACGRINYCESKELGPHLIPLIDGYGYPGFAKRLDNAITAARSARFEHGEKPR